MADVHLAAWKLVNSAEVVTVADRTLEKATKLASKYSIEASKDLYKVFQRPDIDAVDICTPTYLHREHVELAAENGKHILLEKPIATNLTDARKIIHASSKGGIKLQVAHVLRYFSEYRKIRDLVVDGAIGEPKQARAARRGSIPDWASWYKEPEKSGGVTIDLAIHDVDFLRWCLADEAKSVYAREVRIRREYVVNDHVFILIRFRKGAVAHVEASWSQPKTAPFTMTFEIFGNKGMLCYDNRAAVPITVIKDEGMEIYNPDTLQYSPGTLPFPVDPYLREIQDFVESLITDRAPNIPAEEAIKSLEICVAASESSKSCKPVSLPLGD